MTSSQLIQGYRLKPLSFEGGWFRRVYESETRAKENCAVSGIIFLLRAGERSRWHKVSKEERWFYHGGLPVRQLLISPEGEIRRILLGGDPEKGEVPQCTVPANWYQTALPACSPTADPETNYSFCGTIVVPGFCDSDFTGADDAEIFRMFPLAAETIRDFLSCIEKVTK